MASNYELAVAAIHGSNHSIGDRQCQISPKPSNPSAIDPVLSPE